MLSLLVALVPGFVAPPSVSRQEAPAHERMAPALVQAQHKNRRVLLLVARAGDAASTDLAKLLREDAKLRRKMLYEYDLVPASLEADADAAGLVRELGLEPGAVSDTVLFVLDPDRTVVAREAGSAFQDENQALVPAKVMAFLETHQAAPLDAEVLLRTALAQAAATQRRVLVHSGAPW